jgi:glutaredoxin
MFEEGLIVFSGKDCKACETLKSTLAVKGIEYKEYDIWSNAEALRFIMSKGLRGIPQLFKDGVKVGVEDV